MEASLFGNEGIKSIACGSDEAGRGPLAGPVVAAAVILPEDFPLDILDDSKKLSERKRKEAERIIKERAIWATAAVSHRIIDEINMNRAEINPVEMVANALFLSTILAFTIIFLASIVIWFLQSFDSRLNTVTDSADSLLAAIGSFIAPIFSPLGFGDWRISTALITGFMAKESVVSTLTVLFSDPLSSLSLIFTPATAFVFLTFTLLYTPCVAAIATVRRELGRRWSFAVVVLQCVVAWIAAALVRLILIMLQLA